ncbi:WD40 repeat domain-containing protein [Sporobolomyces salmoneus]|uniref:WD40 repeat domain-containing protein n=1 Tax=Sporobolomyces salmoneus TaxID=183962 RepID=UPI00316E1148
MNLELTSPFSNTYPENYESSLDVAAQTARFNPSGLFAGHYIAIGRQDGVVLVLDFETKNVVRWLEGHVKSVTVVCWSQNSRYLLTASRDWNVIIWDLSSSAFSTVKGERRNTLRFDAPVTSANLHPRNSKLCVVTLHAQTQPVFVDLRKESQGRWELEVPPPEEEEKPARRRTTEENGEGVGMEEDVEEEEEEEEDEAYIRRNREVATLARFNPRGDLIYVGTNRGNINIWDVRTKEWLWTEFIGSTHAIKHLEFSPKGDAIIVNSADRILRLISLSPFPPPPPSPPAPPSNPDEDGDEELAAEPEEPEPYEPPPPRPPRIPYFEIVHKFQDLVNRVPWNGCGFSSDGEHVIGGADNKATHNIYVWDRDSGGLSKILEGPKDPLEDLDWHPLRPLILSTSSLGLIHTWVTPIVENWAAYAPGFEELDENREYQEKEDEFDIEDEAALKLRQANAQDVRIDILTTSLPTLHSKTHEELLWPRDLHEGAEEATREFEAWIQDDGDADEDEAFCLAPELDEIPYQGEEANGN